MSEIGGACGTIWKRRGAYAVLVGNLVHVEDLGVFGKIILKWIVDRG
jgi:hypothetical protein